MTLPASTLRRRLLAIATASTLTSLAAIPGCGGEVVTTGSGSSGASGTGGASGSSGAAGSSTGGTAGAGPGGAAGSAGNAGNAGNGGYAGDIVATGPGGSAGSAGAAGNAGAAGSVAVGGSAGTTGGFAGQGGFGGDFAGTGGSSGYPIECVSVGDEQPCVAPDDPTLTQDLLNAAFANGSAPGGACSLQVMTPATRVGAECCYGVQFLLCGGRPMFVSHEARRASAIVRSDWS